MKPWRTTRVLTETEIELIHTHAMKMLSEIGGVVENKTVLEKLHEYGAKVDFPSQRVYFSNDFMEKFIAESEPLDEDFEPLDIKASGGTYGAFWMDSNGKVENFTLESIKEFLKICKHLEHINHPVIPIPYDMGPLELTPLYMRLIGWKYVTPNKSVATSQIQRPELLPYIFEMGELMAEHFGGETNDYVCGDVEFLSPFHFGKEEADILVSLWKKGAHCGIGGPMPIAGATGPVTMAGLLTQNIAETFFRTIVRRVMYNDFKTLSFGCGLSIMDMKTGNALRSTPKTALLSLALGQIVHEKYKGRFRAYSFGTDAQTPSFEAGFQKAMSIFNGLLSGSRYIGELGFICAPTALLSAMQLILDNECLGLLKRYLRGFEISEETIAYDLVKEVGPCGSFLDQMHTAENFRQEIWMSDIFNTDTYQAWNVSGMKTDIDKARDIYDNIMKKDDLPPLIDETTEKELYKIIDKAKK